MLGVHIGIRAGDRKLRAVRLRGWAGRAKPETIEIESQDEPPIDVATRVRDSLGVSSALAVAIDLDSVFVKHVKLPPLPADDRRRMLALEPERFFPVRGSDLVVSVIGDDLAFAVPSEPLREWLEALESLGPIEWVEAAPFSLVRTCVASGLRSATIVATQPGSKSVSVIDLRDGHLADVRKVFGDRRDVAAALAGQGPPSDSLYLTPWSDSDSNAFADLLPGVEVNPLPVPRGLPDVYASAFGVALASPSDHSPALMPDDMKRQATVRWRTRAAGATLTAVAALAFALVSVDSYRARTAERLAAEVASHQEQAEVALALQADVAAMERAVADLTEISRQRPNPLSVLQAITRLLPRDASIRALRNDGDEWLLDGYAKDAARLIPLFEESSGFEGVRFRTATSRAQFGGEVYENFSLALRYVPSP